MHFQISTTTILVVGYFKLKPMFKIKYYYFKNQENELFIRTSIGSA